MAPRRRLDAELVRRELAPSRASAQELIDAKRVLVNGAVAEKATRQVAPSDQLHVDGPPARFVGRGALKLDHALDAFGLDVAGFRALDAGASTGGFTDCLLQGGADRVFAIDVGYGQLAWTLRQAAPGVPAPAPLTLHPGDTARQGFYAAADRLAEMRAALENTFGIGAAPDTLLVGMDTDTDSLRVHLPDNESGNCPMRFVETAKLFNDTLGMSKAAASEEISLAVAEAEAGCGTQPGMRQFILRLLEANLSQIQYVIQHHAGRYAVIGHNERFICAGEAMSELQLRNKFYFAHLDTVEEGTADMDVGIKIFTGLNISRGLAVPVLVHFHYSSRVPGARERAVLRCKRVRKAIEARYAGLHEQGLLHCQMAVSDLEGSERCTFVEDDVQVAGH